MGHRMGKIFTYGMEGDPSHRFLEMRSMAVEDHMVFATQRVQLGSLGREASL